LDNLKPKLNDSPEQKSKKHVLVFIHGFSNTFQGASESVVTIVQNITTFLKETKSNEKVPELLLFSWASGGSINYTDDKKRVKKTVIPLKKFLKFLTSLNCEVSILAHSMGGHLLFHSLIELSKQQQSKFFQIIFIAADLSYFDVKKIQLSIA